MSIDHLPEWRRRARLLGEKLTSAKQRCLVERKALRESKTTLSALLDATTLTQHVAKQVQSAAYENITALVTRCLAIFDEPYTFHVRTDRKRSKTETRLVLERDGIEVLPMDATGGGVVDVLSFALRLACLFMRRPRGRLLLVLDEPFRFVSSEYRPRVHTLLRTLSQDLGVTFILVTHDERLQIGKVVRIT